MEIYVVGKQWMWKIQHPEGVREINELHVPTGRPIKLIMASQDVIHDFFVPAFRIKQDVVPGSYSTEWFIANNPGTYHLFCAQYCGTQHSQMVGSVIVMTPADYQAWLAGVGPSEPPAASGARLYISYGCATCHGARAPTLAGLYGSDVRVLDQRANRTTTVKADETYLRESILFPDAKLVLGYPPIMPSFRGQLTEEQIFDLIAYVKSLGASMSPGQELLGPSTRPANAFPPTRAPDYPPARQPTDFGNGTPEHNK
jgi:cytochrome c oxidase subunit 2